MADRTTPAAEYQLPKPRAPWARDGNAFFIMGTVANALKRAGYPPAAIARYRKESTSDDYDHLVATAMLWCDEGEPDDDNDEEDE